ncbi:neprilysin-11 [Episyrphus balteatus]|uniref:neprilysin-11 n=1 Tax=Episyrphus balteatus TaxID=286459 RepID=UPI00248649D9|nr:neprilysin-11 [Episyrphus balteatus]
MGSTLLQVFSVILLSSLTFGQDTRGFQEFIDTSVNPCEDFYEYACGKWTPLNSEATDVINDQRQENRNIIRDYYRSLRQKGTHETHPPSKFYYSCVNSKLQSDEEILSNHMSTLFDYSDWPYINETFNGSSFDWLEIAAKLRHHQVDTFFKLSVNRNWKASENNHHVLYLTPLKKPFQGSPDGDDAFMYQTYVKYLLLAFGVRVRKAKEYGQDVVDFEFELDNLNQNIEDVLIDPITIDKFGEQFPSLNWKLYFETLLPPGAKQRTPQIVVPIEFVKKLEKLLRKTKPETIALYQLTKFLRHYKFKMDPPTWTDCIDEVNEKMPLSVASDFEDLTSSNDRRASEVFDELRDEFIKQIENTSWYSAKSKAGIIDKLELLHIDIGISDVAIQLEPETEIDQPNYQQARMAFDKLSALNEFIQLQTYNKIASPNLKPLKVNAYYKLTTNSLEIPRGLLVPPLYRQNATDAQIMGSIGSIFGHELVHGLDYDGQNYDQNGNVIMDVNPKDIIQFGKRANCFIDQYSEGRVGALNEDVADNEGMHLAYRAYQKMTDNQPNGNSKFSQKELFFLSYAQIWCQAKESSSRPKSHSSNKERVNNVVANSEYFAEAFTCSKGSKLNPDKKCQIW